ncbi:hypothetical protein PAT3040_01261 [Paenibacillus agaridevorans]|uniref:Lipoprotein n=1 Tax=Paenibacillus agaridevorans TaxID=171404 RepID=A0A2R5EJL2_9BACL|nr:hypothetical protein [Paenibacillus agaridevorans]GBG06727.1 hypothetical protein PAT3040_01261 [Paenibacillus agaridevorans]
MKNKRRTKTAGAAAILMAVMLTASACGANNSNAGQNVNGSPEPGINDQLPEESGIQDPGSIGDDEETKQPEESAPTTGGGTDPDAPADIIISNEGIYTGQNDSNSIEIRTDEGAETYQITEELASAIEALPTDAPVAFEYTEKVIDSEQGIKQLWLTKIEAK